MARGVRRLDDTPAPGAAHRGQASFYDVRDRFVPFIEGLVTQYGATDANLLCVAHGGVLWLMLPLAPPSVDADLMSKHGFGHTTCIVSEIGADGLCCVEWDGVRIYRQLRCPLPHLVDPPPGDLHGSLGFLRSPILY